MSITNPLKIKLLLGFISFFCLSRINAQDYMAACNDILALPIHDTEKVNLLKFKAKDYFDTDVNANIYIMEKALVLANKYKKYNQLLFLYNNLGNSYNDKGDYTSALEYNLKCLRLAQSKGIPEDLAHSYLNLGNTYGEKEEDSLSKECYLKAARQIEKMDDKSELADVYCNLSLSFNHDEEKDSALYYTFEALKMYEQAGDKEAQALCFNNLGLIYMDNADYKKALDYLYKARNINFSNNDYYSLQLVMNNIGDVYLKMGNYNKAFTVYDSALTAFKNLGSAELLMDTYNGLADVSMALKDFEKAHLYRKRYADLNDSVNSAMSYNKFAELKVGYDKEVKDKEIKLLKTENQLQETRKRTFEIVSLVALLFIVAVSWLFYTRYKIKQRSEAALKLKNMEIEEQHKSITDSINYALKIQQAILPEHNEFTHCFKDHFIFFRPKATVSGDFYWLYSFIEKEQKTVILATADCTGHGVPGGFMSMLGSSLLNEIVHEKKITEPADILDLLKIKIIAALKQKGESGENKDGMDISVCKFQGNKLSFAGANNAVYVVRNKELLELKPDKQPIGISYAPPVQFTQQEMIMESGDCVYAFTDGLSDQFGGPKGKKFKYKKLESLLAENAHLPMPEQLSALEAEFMQWQGKLEQVDDVCVIGVKV